MLFTTCQQSNNTEFVTFESDGSPHGCTNLQNKPPNAQFLVAARVTGALRSVLLKHLH